MLKPILIALTVLACATSNGQVVNGSISNASSSEYQYAIGIISEDHLTYHNILDWMESNSGIQVQSSCESHSIVLLATDPAAYKSYDTLLTDLESLFPDVQFFRKTLQIFDRECAGESQK